jgi:DNA-binding XRE family transcriptional regulator
MGVTIVGLPQTKNRVAYWRTIRGMSQGAVANLLGVQRQTISNWERDITLPKCRQVDALARLLRCTVKDLYPREPF